MSFPRNQLGPQGSLHALKFTTANPTVGFSVPSPYGVGATDADEQEYSRLRGRMLPLSSPALSTVNKQTSPVASSEAQERGRCFERSRAAYESGNRAEASMLSEQGKAHGAAMNHYNAQARDYIFHANSANLPEDTIDLHRLHVAEAEEVLGRQINMAIERGEEQLCVIVGKGIHSAGGVTKIKPAVERVLRERGLSWQYEQGNEGKIVVSLVGTQRGHQQGGMYKYSKLSKVGYQKHGRYSQQPYLQQQKQRQQQQERQRQRLLRLQQKQQWQQVYESEVVYPSGKPQPTASTPCSTVLLYFLFLYLLFYTISFIYS